MSTRLGDRSWFRYTLLALLGCVLFFAPNVEAARYTTAQIESNLSAGVQTAVNWDGTCRSKLGSGGETFSSGLRGLINNGSGYMGDTWLSAGGKGNTTTPIFVSSGATTIPLQINSVEFLCGPLVNVDWTAPYTAPTCGGSGITANRLYNDTSRWVLSAGNANDRNANKEGSGCMWPSRTLTRTKITSLSVNDGGYGGVLTALPTETTACNGSTVTLDSTSRQNICIGRFNDSRYWFSAPVPLSYKASAARPITQNRTVTVTMKYKKIYGYHATNESDGAMVETCSGGISGQHLTYSGSGCPELTDTLTVKIQVTTAYNLSPSTTSSTRTILPNETIRGVLGRVQNTGTTDNSDTAASAVVRFVVASGASLKTTAGTATLADNNGYQCKLAAVVASVNRSCSSLATKAGTVFPKSSTVQIFSGDDSLSGVNPKAGDRVCYMTVVNNYDQTRSNSDWRYSAPFCVTVLNGVVAPVLTLTPPSGSLLTDGSSLRADFGVVNNTNPQVSAQVCYRARIWYEKTGNTTLDAGETPYYQKASSGCGGGVDGYATVAADGVTHGITADARAVSLAQGGRICAEWLIGSVTVGVGTGTPNPLVQCITIGKMPSVQVWGNDVRVGSALTQSAAQSSMIRSGLSAFPTGTTTQTVANAAAGLWKTGLDVNGNKIKIPYKATSGLNPNVPTSTTNDSHWSIARVTRADGSSGGTCQQSFNGSSLISMNGSTPARVLLESSPGDLDAANPSVFKAGQYVMNRANVTGDYIEGAVSGNAKNAIVAAHYPYGRVSSGASWIGQNSYGQDYSSSACRDPAFGDPNIDTGNIYIYRMNSPFTIDSGVDLASVRLNVEGGVDNQVKVFVNGTQLVVNNSLAWQRPGFGAGLSFNASFERDPTKPTPFSYTGNTLEVQVQSSGSHTGLLIDKIELSGQKSTAAIGMFGSWGEYGVMAPSTIIDFASNSGLAGGITQGAGASAWSKLTFANTDTSALGRWNTASNMGLMPDIGGYLTSSGLKGVNTQSIAGAYTINTTNVDNLKSGSKVLSASGPVTIDTDIVYPASASDSSSLNQLVIIAPSVNITSNVGRVDAWLIVPNGTINTCSDVGGNLTVNTCNKKLEINGAMTAKQVLLRRTFGADQANPTESAEVLNLRGDAYIWMRRISEQNGTWNTKSVTELPPRY